MYARLISFSGADPARRDEAITTITETVIPMLRQFDGFHGYLALWDAEKRHAKGLILWETKEAGDAAETELVDRRSRIAGSLGLTVESADLYEATVVELGG
jgi:hypothetical protein